MRVAGSPTLLPSCLDDDVGDEKPARVIDVFVDELDLRGLSFEVTTAPMGLAGTPSGEKRLKRAWRRN